jgi:hypothetical protein
MGNVGVKKAKSNTEPRKKHLSRPNNVNALPRSLVVVRIVR